MMLTYSFIRTEDGRFDVSHGDGCYDGRFDREQLSAFVSQLSLEGHTVIDSDNDSYVETAADIA